MQSNIGSLQETVGQLEQARDALVAQAAEQAQRHQVEVAELEGKLEQAETETRQTRATTTQQLDSLKGMNNELAEKLIDLKGECTDLLTRTGADIFILGIRNTQPACYSDASSSGRANSADPSLCESA